MALRAGLAGSRTARRRAVYPVAGLLMLAIAMPTQVVAAGGGSGGGSGGGQPTDTTGSLYADLTVVLRSADGSPILKKYDVPATAETEATTEYCVQPISYAAVPGVATTIDPLDGRQVRVLPLQGEWIGLPADQIPVAEIEACDAQPQYAMFVVEAELERLNLARTSEQVIADKLSAVEDKLTAADEITLDGAGRITTDGQSLDASPEFAAMYASLMQTGTIPGLRGAQAGPPAHVGIFDAWKLAAAAIGTAASKEVPITVDTVEYYNRVVGIPSSADYTSPWGVDFVRSENPDQPGTPMASGERFVDYSGFTYNRSQTFMGSVTWLDVPTLTWKVSRIGDVVPFTQLSADPVGNRTLTGVTAFAQLADDVRAVILYYHNHETIPGFGIDPVGVDTTAARLKAITDPAVAVQVPENVFQGESFTMRTTMFNPFGGTQLDGTRQRVTFDAVDALTAGDLTVAAAAGGQAMDLQVVNGNLVGWWGPPEGSTLLKGDQLSTAFDVVAGDSSALGAYAVHLELVDVGTDTVLADTSGTMTVRDSVPTVLWGDEIYPLVTQATPFPVTATVYAPIDGTADLDFTLTGPGNDPSTDLIEVLRNGDATAYASDGTDMVRMPLALDGEGRLVGTWSMPVAAGYNPVTWYVTIADGALVGGYTVGVALQGGNAVEPALISVAAPESHGQQPPDAGEDTTAPALTITAVGTLGTAASFTLAADEQDVTYQVRLVKDDVPGDWEAATGAGKSFTGLTPGMYSFQVIGTDPAGNVSGVYSKSWVVPVTVEEQPLVPNTTLRGGPVNNSWVLARSARFTVASTKLPAVYVISLNGRYVRTSTRSSFLVSGLRSGVNRITVRAIANGLADPTPVAVVVHVPRGVNAIAHTRGWTVRHGDQHLFGKYVQTRRRGQEVRTRSAAIKRIALVASKGLGNGKVRVFLNGRAVSRVINLSATMSSAKQLIPVVTFRTARHGVVTVRVVSTGKVVRLDGIGVSAR